MSEPYIDGKVIDVYGRPLSHGRVEVVGTGIITHTNSVGEFLVAAVSASLLHSNAPIPFHDKARGVVISEHAKFPVHGTLAFSPAGRLLVRIRRQTRQDRH